MVQEHRIVRPTPEKSGLVGGEMSSALIVKPAMVKSLLFYCLIPNSPTQND